MLLNSHVAAIFFSSRRRHTRSLRDWSSDVCSSDLPALIIDQVALQSNIERMAATAAAHKVALRPHAKTHKSAAIARRQLEAGAIGIACATLLEAEAMARESITGLLVTSPVVGAEKAARLARLNRLSPVAV